MKRSIKTRLVKNFMLIIIITVSILEIVLINGIKSYYYQSVEDILTNQIEFSTNFYSRYYSSTSLQDVLIDDIDSFWRHVTAQVQILSMDGELLMDSLGVSSENIGISSDIIQALDGEKGVWIGNVKYDDYPVMAVSMPLIYQETPVGILRLVSSLRQTNSIIAEISKLLILMGLMVIIIGGIVGLFLANSIVKPLKEVTMVAEKLADGHFKTRSTITLNDEIGRLSKTLNYMAEEILRKDQLKNDFISSISHELRTPLTSIKGWAATLNSLDAADREILKDGLDIIEKESDRLSLMVEDLLDFSRFTSGRISLEKDVFNIKETLELIAMQLKPRAKNNHIDFRVLVDNEIDMMVGDENRIKQVLINLLDNAFKFTDEGGEVRLRALKYASEIHMEVVDNGVGIPSDDLPYVMEKFYKGKNSKSHSGIGLSICEEIVSLHGGSIGIESEEGRGTRVLIRLPLEGVAQ